MRTTLTIDPDVATRLAQEMKRSGQGQKQTINRILRRGFGMDGKSRPAPAFEVRPHHFGIRPGLDLDRMNQLNDELESAAVLQKMER